jgi:hypothetical protein
MCTGNPNSKTSENIDLTPDLHWVHHAKQILQGAEKLLMAYIAHHNRYPQNKTLATGGVVQWLLAAKAGKNVR